MKKRLGFVGIVVEDRRAAAPKVNAVLTEFGDLIVGRMGIPHLEEDHSIITLIVKATTDDVGNLTGKLGQIPGVAVKSGLTAVG